MTHSIDITNFSKKLLSFVVILVMYNSMQLYFTWFISDSLIMGLTYIAVLFNLNQLYITKKRLTAAFLICVVLLYEFSRVYTFSIISILQMFSRILLVSILIFSSNDYMERLLKLIIKVTGCIIFVSLVFWILFLIGLPLPHYDTIINDYYEHHVYYFFLDSNAIENLFLPRFSGIFLEPGHVGSISCLLLFLNGITLRKKENIVFLTAILLSLSLAAYMLLLIGLFLNILLNSKKKFLTTILFVAFISIVVVAALNYNKGENAINEKILERLVFENGEMAGDNRTTMYFDAHYSRYVRSHNVLYGEGQNVLSKQSLLLGTASWKRYFLIRGYAGCFFLLIFLFYYFYVNRTKSGVVLFMLYFLSNLIRDYPLDELFLYLIILGLPIYKHRQLNMNDFNAVSEYKQKIGRQENKIDSINI